MSSHIDKAKVTYNEIENDIKEAVALLEDMIHGRNPRSTDTTTVLKIIKILKR